MGMGFLKIWFKLFAPGILATDFHLGKLGHGPVKHISLSYIETGLPVLWEVVNTFCV